MTEPQAPEGPAGKTVSQMLGEIVWLMSQSQTYRQLFISDLEWFAMPPILAEQFRVFYGPHSPAAVAFWAFVSEETEQRLEAGGHRLRADEWRNGDRPWLVELVAPFGAEQEILDDLARTAFDGRPFKFHGLSDGGERIVKTYEQSLS